ncbi:MAG: hypothetical protein LUC16_02490 [Coprobacillus sp.]|nr:hypothetical protein [Coprobacillus sp.]
MKSKALLSSLLLIPCLFSCVDPDIKVPFPRADEGQLIEISCEELHTKTVVNYETLVVLIGSSDCAECNDAHETVEAYAQIESIIIYYIDMINATESDWIYLVNATTHDNEDTDYYAWPNYGEEAYYPTMYIFYTGYVINEAQTDFVDFLVRHLDFY